MTERTVHCVKLKQDLPGLKRDPLGGALGKRLMEHVSGEAWATWMEHQKMLLNEYRLNLADKKAREFLTKECEKYFFGEGSEAPPEFKNEG